MNTRSNIVKVAVDGGEGIGPEVTAQSPRILNWFAATLGGDNLPNIPLIVSMGGHVRIGLEDHHYADQGMLTNPQIAERASTTIRAMGRQVATPDEARAMLKL